MNVEIIPSGIDLQLFRPMSKERARKFLGLSDGKFLVLFASDPRRLVKRFSLAKEAIRLLESRLNIELVVTSKVPHSKMPLYMNACDALVLTSKHEGSPNVIKEALACNLPIVSVDVGDVREYISKLKGCVLCKDDSPNTIARGLMSVLEGNRLIKGRQAVKELDETILVWKLIGVYQSVLNEKI
jgi:glycosyltransferase involved in cell wall biosynthesis